MSEFITGTDPVAAMIQYMAPVVAKTIIAKILTEAKELITTDVLFSRFVATILKDDANTDRVQKIINTYPVKHRLRTWAHDLVHENCGFVKFARGEYNGKYPTWGTRALAERIRVDEINGSQEQQSKIKQCEKARNDLRVMGFKSADSRYGDDFLTLSGDDADRIVRALNYGVTASIASQ